MEVCGAVEPGSWRMVPSISGTTVGLVPGAASTARSVLLDAMEVVGTLGEPVTLAVNIVVVGTPPGRVRSWHRSALRVGDDRAWGVVVASGQFHEGVDVVPRGHPGDGRLEVQVYDVVAPKTGRRTTGCYRRDRRPACPRR